MSLDRAEKLRFSVLDKCLRNEKFKWNLQALLLQVNNALAEDWCSQVSETQLKQDLKVMITDYGAPIAVVKEGSTLFYEYTDPSFSMQNTTLSVDDLAKLEEACSILKQIRSFNHSNDICFVVNLLDHKMKLRPREKMVLHFEDNMAPGNTSHIHSVKEAILSRRVLQVVYRKLGSAQCEVFVVHPYFLKEYQNRWYIFGYSETSKGPRLYALNRVQELKELEREYIENNFIGSDVYFRSLIGVTVNGRSKPEDVALWVSPKLAPFVISKPLHSSQFRENYDQSGLFIQLHVVINPEFISNLLAFGPDVKVLYPGYLADQIKEAAWKTAEQYNKE